MRVRTLGPAPLVALLLTACGPGDDGSSSGIDAGPDAHVIALDCESYCDQIQNNCLDGASNRQYLTTESCLASCAFFPTGAMTDTSGNTLGCRLYHAGTPAFTDPTTHCPHGGPGGDGTCGMNCEGFCEIVQGACTDANLAYADVTECMTACATFPTTRRYDTNAMTGDTLACRLYHATAATTDPALHCAHTKPQSAFCR